MLRFMLLEQETANLRRTIASFPSQLFLAVCMELPFAFGKL